jgi:hypothetical protein
MVCQNKDAMLVLKLDDWEGRDRKVASFSIEAAPSISRLRNYKILGRAGKREVIFD